jgi:hypothetical protein
MDDQTGNIYMKRLLLASALVLTSLVSFGQDKPKCKGITKAGKACQSTIVMKNGFCRVHNPSAIRCGAPTKAGKPCQSIVKTAGERCRFHAQ